MSLDVERTGVLLTKKNCLIVVMEGVKENCAFKSEVCQKKSDRRAIRISEVVSYEEITLSFLDKDTNI